MFSNSLNIVLASGSPRRQQLLSEAGLEFRTLSVNIAESYPAEMNKEEVPAYLAEKKAVAALGETDPEEVLITADTVVLLDNAIVGKPKNRQEAIGHLQQLSGSMHAVITGVCILTRQEKVVFSERTEVYFKTLTTAMIEYYVDNWEPFDKAGAYAIQEWIGLVGIERIVGNYYNVVGLPVHSVYDALQKL